VCVCVCVCVCVSHDMLSIFLTLLFWPKTDVVLVTKFGTYAYPDNSGIEQRLPYLGETEGLLTTSQDFNGIGQSSWWGSSKSKLDETVFAQALTAVLIAFFYFFFLISPLSIAQSSREQPPSTLVWLLACFACFCSFAFFALSSQSHTLASAMDCLGRLHNRKPEPGHHLVLAARGPLRALGLSICAGRLRHLRRRRSLQPGCSQRRVHDAIQPAHVLCV
jgi:hypothetical protein